MLTNFGLGQHTFTMQQAKSLKLQADNVHEEKMSILALVSAKPLESHTDMVLVRVDELSHSNLFLPVDRRNWMDLLPWIVTSLDPYLE